MLQTASYEGCVPPARLCPVWTKLDEDWEIDDGGPAIRIERNGYD
jgi:hypothetical protein